MKVYCKDCKYENKFLTFFGICSKIVKEGKINEYNGKTISKDEYCKLKENKKGECPYYEQAETTK